MLALTQVSTDTATMDEPLLSLILADWLRLRKLTQDDSPESYRLGAHLALEVGRAVGPLRRSGFDLDDFLILANLYDREERGEATSVRLACQHSALPQTTALRHLQILTRAGLIERRDDDFDQRKTWMILTSQGRVVVEEALQNLTRRVIGSAQLLSGRGSA